MTKFLLPLLFPVLLVGGCATARTEPEQTTVPIISSSGNPIGTASWRIDQVGAHFELTVTGLAPGMHGVHLHSVGKCEAPGFASAAGHWNPTDKRHGHLNAAGWHMGDLGNIDMSSSGTQFAMLILPRAADLKDADGTSLVIHAGPDDEKSDPSGNSGGRIACAVIAPPQ